MPELEVRNGRLNFKIDDRKSPYYFTDADIDFSAAAEGSFDIWFMGEMARTDRMARGLGRVTAQGRLRDTGGEPKVSLDAQLERSALQELAQLAGFRDLPVHGVVRSRAEIAGPVSALQIKGQLDLTELHHWTQPPRAGAVSVSYAGSLALTTHTLRLETDAKQPLRVKLGLDRFLTQPQWSVEVEAKSLGLEPMGEWLRPPGADFNGMKLAGTVDGQLRAGHDAPTAGTATLTALDWTWGEGSRLQAAKLDAEWKDGAVRLAPAALELDGQPLQVDCDWKMVEPAWECRGSSRGHELQKLQRWMKALGLRAEWVEALKAGQVRGSLTVGQLGMDAPQWKGQLELRNAELAVPELAVPVKIPVTAVTWQQDRLVLPSLRASAGAVAWTGSYRYEPGTARPHRVVIDIDAVDMDAVEKVLGPAWKGAGFFSRALGMDEKKESEAAEIEVRAKRIGVAENVRATASREGEKITVTAVSGDWRGGKWNGAGTIRIGGEIDLSGKLAGAAFEGGTFESDWKLTGRARLTLAGKGRLTGGPAEWMAGAYRWESPKTLTLTGLEAQVGGKKVAGRVSGGADETQTVEFGEGLKLRVTAQPFAVTVEGR
jgi:hypothetical protein